MAKQQSSDTGDGKTLFVRNVSFDSETEDLQERFEEFGGVEYCVICLDKTTGHSKGTAFVRFAQKEFADQCLEAAKNQDDRLFVDGRMLFIIPALTKENITQKSVEDKTKDRDKRNIYLAKEGLMFADSPAAEGVSQSDLEKRLVLEKKKRLLLRDITRFVSKTRLCVHNLPADIDDKKLTAICKAAVPQGKIVELRVMRNRNEVTKKFGKSKGFGFIEFAQHEHALEALRKLNNNPDTFTKQQRPIVEFSIESKVALNRLDKRKKHRQQKAVEKNNSPTEQTVDTKKRDRKRGKKVKSPKNEEAATEPKEVLVQETKVAKKVIVKHVESEEPVYCGLQSRPLKENEAIVPPKMNRKVFESGKKLQERRKKLKQEDKAEKVRIEHEHQREIKVTNKRQAKQLRNEKKKEYVNDLDTFEQAHLKRKLPASDTVNPKFQKVSKKSKWFVSDLQ